MRSISKSPGSHGDGLGGRRAAKFRERTPGKPSIGEQEVKNDILSDRKDNEKNCFEFYRKSILTVEVVRSDGQLERAYFFKLPYFDAITKDIK